jgi:cyclohexadieny/prephenate dehydrogenase
MIPPFQRIAIIGLGLIGSSLARAVRSAMPDVHIGAYDADPVVRQSAIQLNLATAMADNAIAAVRDAELVILCVPVGIMGEVGAEIAEHVPTEAIISDVGSCKESVLQALGSAFRPGQCIIPAHPVAGTEKSGPEAGFASLFANRWCILTPPVGTDAAKLSALSDFWAQLGANVEVMEAAHHDRVLAVTSHLPHLIAYTIVGTASDLESVTQSEVIKYSAGGFRDFTRIAASDPTMWRDVFLSNKDAVLEMLQRFSEDLSAMQRAIRWDDGDALFEVFSRTRGIRQSIIEQGQDDAAPDFGRKHS